MPSIVVFNDIGEVVYQNTTVDARELARKIHDEGFKADSFGFSQPVQVNGLILLTQSPPKQKRNIPKLTEKQCMVLQCLANSFTPEQTAIKMGLSENAVREYIKILKKKFKTDSRDQLMAMAGYLGLCDPFENETIEKGEQSNPSD
jgi:DNA-binding CsgD family transcriptional regulator